MAQSLGGMVNKLWRQFTVWLTGTKHSPHTSLKQDDDQDCHLVQEFRSELGETFYGKDGLTQHIALDGTQTNKVFGVTQSVIYPDETKIYYKDGLPSYGVTTDRRRIDFINGQPFLRPTHSEHTDAFAPAQALRQEAHKLIALEALSGRFDLGLLSTPEEVSVRNMFNKAKVPRVDDIVHALSGNVVASDHVVDFFDRIIACFDRAVRNLTDPLAAAYPELGARAAQVRQLEQQARAKLRVPLKDFASA